MNVIISNQQDNIINELNIEVIKSVQGEFNVDDIISSFSNFFFSKMIIDVTALKNYTDITVYQKLSIGLPVDKIILLLPSQTEVAKKSFLSKLISMGYYNFTTNTEGVEYLVEHPNSYKDVAHLHQLNEVEEEQPTTSDVQEEPKKQKKTNNSNKIILGIKNLTENAGATTLTYLIYKELSDNSIYDVTAIEVDKRDFAYFNDDNLVSTSSNDLSNTLSKYKNNKIILLDLNTEKTDLCTDVIYLVEPSIIKMNRLMRRNKNIFEQVRGKKIILNKCLLSNSDIGKFESESGTKIFFAIPPLDDRKRNDSIKALINKLKLNK